MRDSVRSFRLRSLLPLTVLLVAACSGGGGSRSPDLPFPELVGFSVGCIPPGPLAAGQSSQCEITNCDFEVVLANGTTDTRRGTCPTPSWASSNTGAATINETGLLTAVGAGTTTVTASADDVTASTTVTTFVATLNGATVTCSPNTINAGQTSQCTLGNCSFAVLDSNGAPQTQPGQCPTTATWSATPASVGTINSTTGRFTGVGAGTASVTATVGSFTTAPATITVSGACIVNGGLTLTPATRTVIAGQQQTYVATARFSNDTFGDVTTTTTFSSSNTNAATFPAGAGNATASTNADLPATATVTVTGSVSGNTCSGAPVTGTATLTVQPAQVVANGLCLELADGDFQGCRADTGACATVGAQSLTVNQTRQLRLRARFDNGQECNVTNSIGTSFTSTQQGVASVTNTVPPGRGLVTGLSPGSTSVGASVTVGTTTVTATPVAFTVRLNEVLGSNSVSVSAKSLATPGEPRKFACVGATDLVGGLADASQLQGRQKLFAGARFCEPDQIDEATGACLEFLDATPRDVTNDDGTATATNPLANRIAWTQANGYWTGNACATTLPALPIGNGPSALVGDQLTPPERYATGDRQPGENGVVIGAGNLRLGFSCITAEYANPAFAANKDADGMTVLVLPVTNDVLLGSSTAVDATELCDALSPLFQLGASANGGNGAITQLLSVVTEIVNPILQSLASGQEPGNAGPIPVDLIVNQLLNGVDPVTSALFAAGLGDLVALVDDGVYTPLTCGLGALLTALTTADPQAILNAQACVPTVPTFPFPFPAP